MPKVEKFTLASTYDQLDLSVIAVLPDDGAPRALIQLAHGMAENKERYLPFMEFLAQNGYASIINDHRGHGASVKSADDLGYFYANGATALVEDLHQVTQYFRKQYPSLKLFLFGHSMGALAVRCYRQKYDRDIDGLIVCGSPGKNPAAGAGLVLLRILSALRGERYVSKMFINITTGAFGKQYPDSENAWISANTKNVDAYNADPLCGFPFTLNGNRALLTLMRDAYDTKTKPQHPDMPVHFVSGEDDSCAPDRAGFDNAVECMKDAGYTHVTAKLYPGMRHEILNESDAQLVYQDLVGIMNGWCDGK